MVNLANPEWITVRCNDKTVSYIVCYKDDNSEENKSTSSLMAQICKNNAKMKEGECYKFHWLNGGTMDENAITNIFSKHNKLKLINSFVNMNTFEFNLKAASQTKFTIISPIPSNSTFIRKYSYERVLFENTIKVNIVNIKQAEGYLIFVEKPRKANNQSGNLFTCSNGQIISSMYVLDRENDCGDIQKGSDESSFPLKCEASNCSCSLLHYKTMKLVWVIY